MSQVLRQARWAPLAALLALAFLAFAFAFAVAIAVSDSDDGAAAVVQRAEAP